MGSALPGVRGIRRFALPGLVGRWLLALNAFCWLLFMTRDRVNPADYAAYRMMPGGGIEFLASTASPYVVASRAVARGGWHGLDTPPVEAYRKLNLPGLAVGGLAFAIGEIPMFVIRLGSKANEPPSGPEGALDPFPAIESWLLAGCLLAGTSLQWLLLGHVGDRLVRRVLPRADGPWATRSAVATWVLAAVSIAAWWWPVERDWYLLSSSFDGRAGPILKALETEPMNAELWRRLGRAYRMKDRWVDARPAYRRSVELDPTNFDAWANLRLASLCLADSAEAERAGKQLLVLDREWAESRMADQPRCCVFEVCPR